MRCQKIALCIAAFRVAPLWCTKIFRGLALLAEGQITGSSLKALNSSNRKWKENLKKDTLAPPSSGTFSTSLRCKDPELRRPGAPLEGSRNFSGGRLLWCVFIPLYTRAHAKGAVLLDSEKACFCLLCAFSTAPS